MPSRLLTALFQDPDFFSLLKCSTFIARLHNRWAVGLLLLEKPFVWPISCWEASCTVWFVQLPRGSNKTSSRKCLDLSLSLVPQNARISWPTSRHTARDHTHTLPHRWKKSHNKKDLGYSQVIFGRGRGGRHNTVEIDGRKMGKQQYKRRWDTAEMGQQRRRNVTRDWKYIFTLKMTWSIHLRILAPY